MNEKLEIANLVKLVSQTINDERAAKCAYDCLMQWNDGHLGDTILAWHRHLKEHKNNQGHTDTERNGVWVPAIPL